MFGFRKDKSAPTADKPEQKKGFFGRIKSGLARTRDVLNSDVRDLIALKKQIDDEVLEELETHLLMADVGVEATQAIISDLTARASRKELADADALFAALRAKMIEILAPVSVPLEPPAGVKPFSLLMVGINGAGKTTTIGKLAAAR